MKPGYSKILVDDIVIPLQGASKYGCRLDFQVMALCAAVERTVPQWHALAESVGLKVDKVWSADPTSEGLVEISL
jgi:hypothetical protein